MKRFLLLIAFLSPCLLRAQAVERILADTSVSWAAVVESLLPVDPLNGNDSLAEIQVLKLKSVNHGLFDYASHSLNWHIWQAADEGHWQYFADAALKLPLDYDAVLNLIGRPDTIIDFDPETYEEKIKIAWDVHCCPPDYPFLKIRRLLSWRRSTAAFELIPLAFAPVEHDGNALFWIKYPEIAKAPVANLDAPEILWALRYVTAAASPDISDLKVLKGGDIPIAKRLFQRLAPDASLIIYASQDEKPASPEERDDIFRVRTDSALVFNPETYEEVLQPVSKGYRPEDVVDLRFVEEWVWDKRQKLFFTRLLAVAPRVRTEDGWRRSIFYLPVR